MKKFNNFIKQKRKKKGLTVIELAEMLDIHRTYIHLIENGRRIPSLDILLRLLQALEVSEQEFGNVSFKKYPKEIIKNFLKGEKR